MYSWRQVFTLLNTLYPITFGVVRVGVEGVGVVMADLIGFAFYLDLLLLLGSTIYDCLLTLLFPNLELV